MPDQIQPASNYFAPVSQLTVPPAPPVTPPSSFSPAPTIIKESPFPNEVSPGKKRPFKLVALIVGVLVLVGAAFVLTRFLLGKMSGNKQTTLIYWGLFEPQSVMQQVISEFEKSHPGIKIVYSQQDLIQYREKLQQRLSAGSQQQKGKDSTLSVPEIPDIFRIHQSWVPMFSGLLSTVLPSVYDSVTFEKTFYPSAIQSLKYQGQYMGIPLMVDGLALFCNEDLFKAKGIEFPKDWKELKTAAQQLTTRDSQGRILTAGVALGTASNVDHWSDILGMMLLQSGVSLENPSSCSKGDDERDVCPGADALKFFTNFATEDRVWDSTLPTSTFAFAKGNLAMYFAPSWRVFDIEGMKGKLQSSFQYKIVPVPQLPTEEERKISWSSYWVEAVSKKSKNQTEAWEFLKYLSSKEVAQKLFQTQSAIRPFGEPYSRLDMAELLKDHPFASAFISQAPYAKNWYLSSFTSDNGINDKIIKYYEDAVNSVNRGDDPVSALQTAGKGVTQILTQYGVSK